MKTAIGRFFLYHLINKLSYSVVLYTIFTISSK